MASPRSAWHRSLRSPAGTARTWRSSGSTRTSTSLAGAHAWADADFRNVTAWGIHHFGPGELRESSRPLLDWLTATGCSRAAIHFDVDAIDSNEIVLGLGAEPDGLTSAQVRRIVAGLDDAGDVVEFTLAEFIPRQVIHLQQILQTFPLISRLDAG